MTKLQEQKQQIQDIEDLIKKMKHELDYYRSIIARYHKKHGEEIDDSDFEVDDSIDIGVQRTENNLYCILLSTNKFGLTSSYLSIKNELKKLGL